MEASNGPLMFIVFIATAMILCAILGGILAGLKNRDYSFWIAWSFLVPPAVIVLLFLPTLKGRRPRRITLDEEDARDRD